MNGKKAKAIRKAVYRDVPGGSTGEQRRYVQHTKTKVVYVTGHRRAYVDAKKLIKERGI